MSSARVTCSHLPRRRGWRGGAERNPICWLLVGVALGADGAFVFEPSNIVRRICANLSRNPVDVETSSHVTPQQAVEVMFDVQRAPTHIGQQTSRHRHLNTFRKRT